MGQSTPWKEIKDEKIAEWLAHRWEGSDTEDQFEREFNAEWYMKHDTPHPDDIERNLFISIKNANGPYEIPDDPDDVLIHAAWNLEAAGHIIIDHDLGPKILAIYIPHEEDEDLFDRIRNAVELYEVPNGSLEVALRLERAGRIKLAYSSSSSKTYANVIDKPVEAFMDRAQGHTDNKKLH